MSLFLECRHLCYRYPGQAQDLLSDISFSVERGDFVGILGAEDSGKTTLARLLKGLLLPTAGNVCLGKTARPVLSEEIQSQELTQYRHAFGAVFSDPEHQIVGTSVEEDVAFGLGNLQIPSSKIRQKTDRILGQLDLAHYAKRPPHKLSGGEQQKLCVASILAMEPECLIFDEPLSFLDRKSRRELLQLFRELNQQGKSVIYLTSDPEELLSANRILLLLKGCIVKESTIRQLWQQPTLLEEIDIVPPDFMLLRDELLRSGYTIRSDSFSPEALVKDICGEL